MSSKSGSQGSSKKLEIVRGKGEEVGRQELRGRKRGANRTCLKSSVFDSEGLTSLKRYVLTVLFCSSRHLAI